MNELELKRKRYETVGKVAGLGGVIAVMGLAAPFLFSAVVGLGLFLTFTIVAAVAVNFAPWFGMKLANWKLKALKAEAEANPLETLENQYRDKAEALVAFKANIEQLHAETRNVYDQIKAHREEFPDTESQFEAMYQTMVGALNDRVAKYKQVQASLTQFSKVIEQKRSEFRVAQALAKARKAAGVGMDFVSKLMEDTAVNAVKTKLNLEFAALETSILDNSQGGTVVVTAKPTAALPQHAGPPTLDLDFDEPEKVVKLNKGKAAA